MNDKPKTQANERKRSKDQGICLDDRAQEQPKDKERAQGVTHSRDNEN